VSFWIVVRVGKETRCTPCRSFSPRILAVVACQDWHIDGATLWNIYTGLKDTRYQMAGAVTPERPTASWIGPDSTMVFSSCASGQARG